MTTLPLALAASLLALTCTQVLAHERPDHDDDIRFQTRAQKDDSSGRLGTRTETRSLGAHSDGLGRLGDGTGSSGRLGTLQGGTMGRSRDHGLGVYRGGGLGAWSGSSIGDPAPQPTRRGDNLGR